MLKQLFKKVLCCILYAVVILGILYYVSFKIQSAERVNTKGQDKIQLSNNNEKQDKKVYKDNTSSDDENYIKANYNKYVEIYNNNKDTLILANRDNPLPTDYKPSLRHICNGRLEASNELYSSLVQMLADAKLQGYTYWISSAYRSAEKQQKLVDEDVYTCMVRGMSYKDALEEVYKETMPAGCSEHQTGLALDILCSGNSVMDASQKDEPGNKWLRKNCYKYGFILRYPEDKSGITGINFEPWHFRYVGKEAAKFIMKSGITLEEFYMAMEQ